MTSTVRFAPRHGYSLFKRGKLLRQTYLPVDKGPSQIENKPQGKKKRKRAASSTTVTQSETFLYPWADNLPHKQYESLNKQLHHDIVAYTEYVRPTDQEMIAHGLVFSAIEQIAKQRFRDCTVQLFGSSATKLTIPVPDLDIIVSTRFVSDNEDQAKYLRQLSSRLRMAGLTDRVFVRAKAKVPILNFTTFPKYGSLSVDVGINNLDGMRCVTLVNDYLSKMPALRPLILVVKGFLKQRGLHSAATSGLGSYAATLMCISFLQLNPMSRSIEEIENPFESESLGRLFTDFLEYYGLTFPYSESYISVTEGKLLPKEGAEWINQKDPNRLAIQCLLRPENDIARATSRIGAVKQAFKEGFAEFLKAPPNEYRLGLVVGIKQSVLDHRAHIKQLFDAQVFQSNHPRWDSPYRPRYNDNRYRRDDGYSRESQRSYGLKGDDRRPNRSQNQNRGGSSQG